jgi:esterase/lipase superfamily enzyme
VDIESWSKKDGNPRQRIETHERFYNYICNELVPRIKAINNYSNGGFGHERVLTTGCSLGAFHALNFALRRPDLFSGTIAMSGIYEAGFFFKGYGDDLTYANSPVDYLRNMPADHPYVEAYRNSDLIVSVGQGRWENECLDSIHKLAQIVNEKQLDIWIDFWGYDVDHDWPWWKKQIVYFLQFVC